MRRYLFLAAALQFAAAAAIPAWASDDSLSWARIGQSTFVDGPRVTPLRVLEDSRCPMEARCAWAGQVRLQVRIRTGRGSALREITSASPIPVADGELELVSVMPPRSTQRTLRARDYRFGFRFYGGL